MTPAGTRAQLPTWQAGLTRTRPPLPAFPEPPRRRPARSAPPPGRLRLRRCQAPPAEPWPRPHLLSLRVPYPPPAPSPLRSTPARPRPRFRAPTASARGRHRRRPREDPGRPPGRGAARKQGAGGTSEGPTPSPFMRPAARRVRSPPPLGAPCSRALPPASSPPLGGLERRAPPEISAVGEHPWMLADSPGPAQARFLGGPAG